MNLQLYLAVDAEHNQHEEEHGRPDRSQRHESDGLRVGDKCEACTLICRNP